jgi:sialate O-acetylesterase
MISKFTTRFCALTALTFAFVAQAEVKLHGLFSDNMVLQRDAAVPVWGWADDGEKVTVEFRNQKVSTTAKDGKWMVKLKKLKAGGPDELRVNGKNAAITLKNVLVGEVWIASGQSNMEWPMRASFSPDTELPKTENAMLRLYTVPKLKAEEPRDNVPASWQLSNPSTTPGFSAVAYYFGRDLAKALNVPVGIIHTSWGGSPAEVWMSQDVLTSNPAYKPISSTRIQRRRRKAKEAIAAFEKEEQAAKAEGKTFNKRRPGMPWRPTELYNGMIAPLIPYAIKGAIWYQGESNAGRAHQYRTLFADMIRNWRADWDQGDFPFLLVQLAPFMAIKEQPGESTWAELREAQALATKKLPKVGMAVITDVGDEKDIHPKKKEPVGARLALAAQKIAYGQDIVYSGPTYKAMKVKDGKAVLTFENTGSGLEARGGELKGIRHRGCGQKVCLGEGRNPGRQGCREQPRSQRTRRRSLWLGGLPGR